MDQQTDSREQISQGNALLVEQRPAEAAAAFARAAHADPQAVEAHLGLAEANLALGQMAIVSTACQHVRMLAPGSADAALADAIMAAVEGRPDEALASLDQVSKQDPTRAYTYALRAWVLRRMGQAYEASLAEARAARITGQRDWSKLFPPIVDPTASVRANTAAAPKPAEPVPGVAQRITYQEQRSWQVAGASSRLALRMRFLFRTQPVITYSLIIINVAVYLVCLVFSRFDLLNTAGHADNPIYPAGWLYGVVFQDPTQWYRLLTSMFLHASILHIGLNMFGLYVIGRIVETAFGARQFAVLYFIGGFAGGLLNVFLAPNSAAIGASGAVFAIFGALGAFLLLRRRQLGPAVNGLLTQWFLNLAINVFFSLSFPGIAYWDHLGGFVCGFALAAIMTASMTGRR